MQMTATPTFDLTSISGETITDLDQLETLLGTPRDTSIDKESVAISSLEQAFIEASPFVLLATSAADGTCDVSPRGDPAGSVAVVDDRTLIIAERPGNKRADSLRNIVTNPQVGLLFLVPGCDETLRVNGTAQLTTSPAITERLTINGKPPQLAIVVRTSAVYMHCARAFRRSKLWDSSTWPERGTVPQMPAILKEKLAMAESVEEISAEREGRYKTTLY
jgi:PPOX class probable FMN-dependent enzyme